MTRLPILVLLLGACSGSEMFAPPAEGRITLRPGTVVVDDPGALATLAPGTIAISGGGDGFIRRVTPGGSEPATLFDAVAGAEVRQTFTLADVVVDDELQAKLDVDATVHATLAPTIDLAFTIDDTGLTSFDAAITGRLATHISSELDLLAGGGWDGVETFHTPPVRLASVIDGVPIVLVARVTTDIALYAGGPSRLVLGTTAISEVDLDARAHFDPQAGWSTLDRSQRTVEGTTTGTMAVTAGRGHVDTVVTMKLEVSLYDRPGAYVQLRATSDAEAGGCVALGEGSIAAGMGVNASALFPDALMQYAPLFRQVHPQLTQMTCQ